MHIDHGTVVRTDIWREGKWLDLWSVVHALSSVSLALGLFYLQVGAFASIALALLLLISYEMWEVLVKIKEETTNRYADVVLGMLCFLPTFFVVAPRFSGIHLVYIFVFVLAADIALSTLGWRASQKASALEKRLRERYNAERTFLLKQKTQLHDKFHR